MFGLNISVIEKRFLKLLAETKNEGLTKIRKRFNGDENEKMAASRKMKCLHRFNTHEHRFQRSRLFEHILQTLRHETFFRLDFRLFNDKSSSFSNEFLIWIHKTMKKSIYSHASLDISSVVDFQWIVDSQLSWWTRCKSSNENIRYWWFVNIDVRTCKKPKCRSERWTKTKTIDCWKWTTPWEWRAARVQERKSSEKEKKVVDRVAEENETWLNLSQHRRTFSKSASRSDKLMILSKQRSFGRNSMRK